MSTWIEALGTLLLGTVGLWAANNYRLGMPTQTRRLFFKVKNNLTAELTNVSITWPACGLSCR